MRPLNSASRSRSLPSKLALNAKVVLGNLTDAATLRFTVKDAAQLTRRDIERVYVDKGCRGLNVPTRGDFISGQKRGGFGTIKWELPTVTLTANAS